MNFELEPTTDSGKRFVAACEDHIDAFASRAGQHDREGSFPFENFEDMKASGVLAASVPAGLGGMGVESIHDLMVGTSRLGRGDGSTAIAVNMHFVIVWTLARAAADASEIQPEMKPAIEGLLGQVASQGTVLAILGTEAGTHAFYPQCEARAVDGGWSINGTKIFGTLSPVAGLYFVAVRHAAEDGSWETAYAWVPAGTPGCTLNDDWDALGMRASGSGSVTFKDCLIPANLFIRAGKWGDYTTITLTNSSAGQIGLVGASLAIAESAHASTVEMLKTRRKAPSGRLLAERPSLQTTVAEMEIDIAASRAMLARSGRAIDDYFMTHLPSQTEPGDLHELAKDLQCTKTFVNAAAIRIVDWALQASGGAGFMSSNPLSRLYRDVRAGPFMQPWSPNEAYEYIGKVALGLDPTVDL